MKQSDQFFLKKFMFTHNDLQGQDFFYLNFLHLNRDEADLVLVMRNHPEIRKNMYGNRIIGRQEHQKFLTGLKHRPKVGYWLIKAGPKVIGTISITESNLKSRQVTIGIYVHYDLLSQGFGSRILKDFSGVLAQNKFKKINIEVLKINQAGIRFYEKNNFVYTKIEDDIVRMEKNIT